MQDITNVHLLVSLEKMKKFIVGSLAAAALLVAGTASAATFSNVQFDNNDVTISGQGGNTVNATFHVVVPANQVVENIQTDVIGDNLAPVCTSVGGDLGLQEGTHDVTVQVKLPPNTGTYTLNVQGAGIYGGIRSIDCNDSVVGTGSFSGALRTVSTGSDTTSGPSVGSADWMAQLIAALKAALTPTAPTTPTTPAPSTLCAQLTNSMLGAQQNVYNSANVALQGFLLYQHQSIPALAAGASFGFWGPQTNLALMSFKAANSCQ